MILTWAFIGAGLIVSKSKGYEREINRQNVRSMERVVREGERLVRANASGRPGPRVITDQYRKSIQGKVVRAAGAEVAGSIGTSAVQGPRLEFGFFGPDSLGRPQDPANRPYSPPFPHFQPAIGDIAEYAERAIGEGVRTALQVR